jgi:hypothetical protein
MNKQQGVLSTLRITRARKPKGRIVLTKPLLAAAVVFTTCHAFGQVFHEGEGTAFGTAYGSLGSVGNDTWQEFRKYNTDPTGSYTSPVTASNVSGNGTQVQFSGNTLGCCGATDGYSYNAMGVFADALATGPASSVITNSLDSDQLYLKGLERPGGPSKLEIRLGFMESPSDFFDNSSASRNGDGSGPGVSDIDMNGGNWNTNGVSMYLQIDNSTTSTWTTSSLAVNYVAGGSTLNQGNRANYASSTAVTYINSGASSTGNVGASSSDGVELSWKMYEDAGTVYMQAKIGNTLFTAPVNISNPGNSDAVGYTGGAFDWQNAKPVIYIGQADFEYPLQPNGTSTKNPSTATLGVLHSGDADTNGLVNIKDVNAMRNSFGGQDKAWSNGDFNQDGLVDNADLAIVQSAFGTNAGVMVPQTPSGPASSPDPGQIRLLIYTDTGEIVLDGGFSAIVSSYEIYSASGSLVSGNWLSLGGFLTFSSTSNDLAQADITGGGMSIDGTQVSLGNIFHSGGTQDIVFTAFDDVGNQVDIGVTYAAVPEPTVVALVAMGGAVLLLGSVRRRCRGIPDK